MGDTKLLAVTVPPQILDCDAQLWQRQLQSRRTHEDEAPMTDATPETNPAPPASQEVPVSPAVQSAGRWFYWIVGLSVINTIMSMSGSNTSFVMGLAMTAVSDALFSDTKVVAFVIDAIVLAFFAFVGMQAVRGRLWAFYLGVVVYAIDALIYLAFGDWMPVAFHGLALFFIARGAITLISERQQRA